MRTTPSVRIRFHVAALSLGAALLLASAARADTVRGSVTKCGAPATGLKIQAFVDFSEGFKEDRKPCTITSSTVKVGEAPLDAAGRYSLAFDRPVRDEDACSFSLKGTFVELRDAVSGALVWRSATEPFAGASTTFVFDRTLDCPPPPPPPPGDLVKVGGRILLCGLPAAGFKVTAVTEVRLGFDMTEFGGRPCELSSPQYAIAGTTTAASDGTFSISYHRPVNSSPDETCAFHDKVFIRLFDPATGGLIWFSSTRDIAANVTFDEDLCRFFVAVSVKVVLDSSGHRPSGGYFSTDAQIERAISQANTVLANNDVGWRLFLTEIVNVEQPQYFRLDDASLRQLERDAKASPAAFLWRSDAVNVYVVDDLKSVGHSVGGVCSFPAVDEIIAVNSSAGILNEGVGWIHEIGHFLSLTHTFECLQAECDKSVCTKMGAFHGGAFIQCPDNCPHDENVMSYNSFDVADAVFSACQIQAMNFELFDPAGSRAHVLRRQLPTGMVLPRVLPDLPSFLRGDSNSSGAVDISDALNTLGVLLLGTGAITCPDAADANDDGRLDISDAVATLSFLFLGRNLVAAPGALTCSPDGKEDSLGPCGFDEAKCPKSHEAS